MDLVALDELFQRVGCKIFRFYKLLDRDTPICVSQMLLCDSKWSWCP